MQLFLVLCTVPDWLLSLFTTQVANILNILAPSGSCQVQQLTKATLDFVVPSTTSVVCVSGLALAEARDFRTQCSTLALSVSGGTPPYTLHVLPENVSCSSLSPANGFADFLR